MKQKFETCMFQQTTVGLKQIGWRFLDLFLEILRENLNFLPC